MENNKKKVLIITYYWPPSGGAGVQRWLKFAKYLPEFGIQPIIYTPSNPESPSEDYSLLNEIKEETVVLKKTIWEPYTWYKRILGQSKSQKINAGFLSETKKPKSLERISIWIRGNLFIPDARKFWIKPSIKYLKKYINEHNIDTIISTGPPHSMHLIALNLKQKMNIKWVADFRDPWTNIDFYKDLMLSKRSDKKHKRLEKRVLKEADLVITVGETLGGELKELGAKRVEVITNGYDSSDIPLNKPKLDIKFSISHVGAINKDRNHSIFIEALKELVYKNPEFSSDLEIRLIGKVDHSIIDDIEQNELTKYLVQIPYITHDKVLNELLKSRILYLPINNTPNAKGIVTGKFFEYLASERPILSVGPTDGDIAKILKETKAGEIFDFNDIDGVLKYIEEKYIEFKNGINSTSSIDSLKYTRKNLTKALSKLLKELEDE